MIESSDSAASKEERTSQLYFRNWSSIPRQVKEFAFQRSMHLGQASAQRIIGPRYDIPEDVEPPEGCEIYIGRIPQHLMEPDLLPVFEKAGPIFKMRLFVNFSGLNKGYCFVKYFNQVYAQQAVREFHCADVFHEGRSLICSISVDNRKLFFVGVPMSKSRNQIETEIRAITDGVIGFEIIWPTGNISFPKGLARVTYSSHSLAALARKKWLCERFLVAGSSITVGWASPDDNTLFTTCPKKEEVLRVKDVSASQTLEIMKKLNTLEFDGINFVKRQGNELLLYVDNHQLAEIAKLILENIKIGGERIRVYWQ